MIDRDRMISENIGLVHACAKRFKARGVEYEDLFQAGCMGLVKAVDHFEEERGLRFSTYAVPVILGEMRRLFRDGGSIKVGRSLKELSLKATRATAEFNRIHGRTPTIGELAAELGVEITEAAQAVNAGQHQVLNAATVLAALDVLRRKGFKLPLQAVAEGFAQVSFPARLELLSKHPIFLLDGAHNPNGVQALAAALRQYLSGKRITAIMGMLADKDSHASIGYLNGLLDQVYTLTPDNPRAMQAEDFAALWREMGVSAKAAQSPRQAVELALAHAGSDGAIIVCGSLYLAAEIRPIAIEILKGMAPSA